MATSYVSPAAWTTVNLLVKGMGRGIELVGRFWMALFRCPSLL